MYRMALSWYEKGRDEGHGDRPAPSRGASPRPRRVRWANRGRRFVPARGRTIHVYTLKPCIRPKNTCRALSWYKKRTRPGRPAPSGGASLRPRRARLSAAPAPRASPPTAPLPVSLSCYKKTSNLTFTCFVTVQNVVWISEARIR